MSIKTPSTPIRVGTILRLIKATRDTPLWEGKIGRIYQVDSYSRKDGLNVVWLIDTITGQHETTDQADLLNFFEIVAIGRDRKLYNENLRGGKKGAGKTGSGGS